MDKKNVGESLGSIDHNLVGGASRSVADQFSTFIQQIKPVVDIDIIASSAPDIDTAASFSQKRGYFLKALDRAPYYSRPFVIEIFDEIDHDLMLESITKLLNRHGILRTSLEIQDGNLLQKIVDQNLPNFIQLVTDETEVSKIIENFVDAANATEALLDSGIFSISDKHHVILLYSSKIKLDSRSFDILLNDLYCIYYDLPLFSINWQYKDYAIWQQNNICSNTIVPQKNFWLSEFKDKTVGIELPLDYKRPLRRSYVAQRFDFHLDDQASEDIIKICEDNGLETFTFLSAIYNVLLSKLSNGEDIVVAWPISDRHFDGFENMVGDFDNVLPVRSLLDAEMGFIDYAFSTGKKLPVLYKSGHFAYEILINELISERDFAKNPLIDAQFLPYPQQVVEPDDKRWRLNRSNPEVGTSSFDLSLSVLNTNQNITLSFEYATELFKQDTIERFIAYYKNIVNTVITNIHVPLRDIEILTHEEKSEILQEFNNTSSEWPGQKGIIEIFEEICQTHPEKVALKYNGSEITYAQLETKADQLACLLSNKGVRAGDIVTLFMDRSQDYIAALMAVLRNGAIYMPVDLTNPDERINFMISDSRSKYVLTRRDWLANRNIELPEKRIYLEDGIDHQILAEPGFESSFSDDIYLMYTSGSTGKPKGVLGTQKGLLNRLQWGWENLPFSEDEVCCQKTSLSFVDHVVEVFAPLLKGVTTVILNSEEVVDANNLVILLKEHHISRITVVPTLLKSISEAKKQVKINLDALKYVFCSGDVLTTTLANEFYESFSNCKLYNIYGSTEVSADATAYYVDRFDTQEILKYFKNLSDESDQKSQFALSVHEGKSDQHVFTKPNVSLATLATRFTDSALATHPMSLQQYYTFFDQEVLPYTIDTASPTFIGHMTSVLPDYVHDLSKLISQMNQNLVKIETSKAVTFVEREAVAILHRLFYDLPREFYDKHIQRLNANLGIITSGGTIANISALLTARNKGLFGTLENRASYDSSIYALLHQQGYKDMVFIGTRLMHYSFKKALSILGLGVKNMLFVENAPDGSMITSDLQDKIDYCRREKLFIIAVVGIAGSTERGSIDPLPELGAIARKNNIHFHVDAAWGGAVMFSNKFKHLLNGVQDADSITFCGHKQLFLPQGISVCLFKDPDHLNFNATTANYQAQANSYDFGRFTIEGSRPALSICLHASLRILGQEGFGLLVENGIEKARLFASIIQETEGFELLSRHMNIINYRYVPQKFREAVKNSSLSNIQIAEINEVNTEIQQRQFYKAETFVSKTTIQDAAGNDIIVFRVVLSNPLTTHEDLLEVIQDQVGIIAKSYGEYNNMVKAGFIKSDKATLESDAINRSHRIPIGKPISNMSVLILDDHDNLQPIGVPGEICISGVGVTAGYHHKPELTQKSFDLNPYNEDEKMYRTGDLGKWKADGNIEFIGRRDNQVKIKGHRVELAEIEYAINEYANVKASAVLLGEFGPDEKRLIAFVVAQQSLDIQRLKHYLAERMPVYMIPSEIVILNKLPLMASGKLNRSLLMSQLSERVSNKTEFVEPTSEIEKELAKIWEECLGVTSIGLNDTFFDLGGHSLLLISMRKSVNEHYGIDLPLSICFVMTLEQLAGEVLDRVAKEGVNW